MQSKYRGECKKQKRNMVLRKFSVVVLMGIFVILPIVLQAGAYYGYDHKQFYPNQFNTRYSNFQTSTPERNNPYYGHNGMQGKISSRHRASDWDDRIIFPDEGSIQRRIGSSKLRPVPRCIGQTFCENISNYPQQLMNNIIARNSSLMQYSNVDAVDTSISHRMDGPDETTICVATERILYPKTAQSSNKEWMYLLQSNELNFLQGVKVEICEQAGTECKMVRVPGEGYVTECKQKYILRQLTAVDEDGKVTQAYFQFPASCCCHMYFRPDD